jgi:hypothetical protein
MQSAAFPPLVQTPPSTLSVRPNTNTQTATPSQTMTATANELAANVGREGLWSTPIANIQVRVKVIDARQIFGRVELKVTPLAGSGEAWAQNVKIDKPAKPGVITLPIGTSGKPGGLP